MAAEMAADPELTAETRAWLTKSANDLRAADALIHSSPPLLDEAVFHCQQAAEKSFKGFQAFGLFPRPCASAHGNKSDSTFQGRASFKIPLSAIEFLFAEIAGLTGSKAHPKRVEKPLGSEDDWPAHHCRRLNAHRKNRRQRTPALPGAEVVVAASEASFS
jgi:hypothetical protein